MERSSTEIRRTSNNNNSDRSRKSTMVLRKRSSVATSSPVFLILCLSCFLLPSASSVRYNEDSNDIFPSPGQLSDDAFPDFVAGNSNNNRDKKEQPRIFYQTGNSDADLPVCSPHSVCNKVDTYGTPWVEKQCRCPLGKSQCSTSVLHRDGFSVVDRSRQYKTCEPVRKLRRCKYFRDVTWTLISYPDNTTQQVMHCKCPKNSVAYLIKRSEYQADLGGGTGFQYSFACSPQTKIRCERKEPCRLFSVRKDSSISSISNNSSNNNNNNNNSRPQAEEVNASALCQCPHRRRCPKHHLDVGVIPGKTFTEDPVRTYSAYCM